MSRFLMIASYAALLSGCGDLAFDSIEYRGERIKLSRRYVEYDDYKNDPGNIHPSEVARVQGMVRSAPVGASFSSWEAAAQAVSGVVFPGYGSASFRSDRSRVRVLSVEVPQANQERVFVFRPAGEGWALADDFLMPESSPSQVLETAEGLEFRNARNERILVRPTKLQ